MAALLDYLSQCCHISQKRYTFSIGFDFRRVFFLSNMAALYSKRSIISVAIFHTLNPNQYETNLNKTEIFGNTADIICDAR